MGINYLRAISKIFRDPIEDLGRFYILLTYIKPILYLILVIIYIIFSNDSSIAYTWVYGNYGDASIILHKISVYTILAIVFLYFCEFLLVLRSSSVIDNIILGFYGISLFLYLIALGIYNCVFLMNQYDLVKVLISETKSTAYFNYKGFLRDLTGVILFKRFVYFAEFITLFTLFLFLYREFISYKNSYALKAITFGLLLFIFKVLTHMWIEAYGFGSIEKIYLVLAMQLYTTIPFVVVYYYFLSKAFLGLANFYRSSQTD